MAVAKQSRKLRTGSDFKAVFAVREGRSSTHLSVKARPNGREYGRLGQAISKKVCPTAVGRNYMKRVCRALFMSHAAYLQGLDVVVFHKKRFDDTAFKSVSNEFDDLVRYLQRCRDFSK